MTNVLIKIDAKELQALADLLEHLAGDAVEAAVKRSRARWATEYKRQLRMAIDERTTRRTGTLRKSPKIVAKRNGTGVFLRPTFPTTAFVTSTVGKRGRRGRKQGQWAFVVDHNRGFIALANSRMGNNQKVADILGQNILRSIAILQTRRT